MSGRSTKGGGPTTAHSFETLETAEEVSQGIVEAVRKMQFATGTSADELERLQRLCMRVARATADAACHLASAADIARREETIRQLGGKSQ